MKFTASLPAPWLITCNSFCPICLDTILSFIITPNLRLLTFRHRRSKQLYYFYTAVLRAKVQPTMNVHWYRRYTYFVLIQSIPDKNYLNLLQLIAGSQALHIFQMFWIWNDLLKNWWHDQSLRKTRIWNILRLWLHNKGHCCTYGHRHTVKPSS